MHRYLLLICIKQKKQENIKNTKQENKTTTNNNNKKTLVGVFHAEDISNSVNNPISEKIDDRL